MDIKMFNFFLSFSLIFASIFSLFFENEPPHKKKERLMASIVSSSTKQLSKRYGLTSIGGGGGNIDNKSKREYVAFQLYKKITKEEARILIVEVVELFLHNINQNCEVASYLYDSPFTYHNLEFAIFILNPDRTDTYDPDIGLVSLTRRGTVSFVTYEKGPLCTRASDVEEPYEEAYKIATQREYGS